MVIEGGGTPHWAAVVCSGTYEQPGAWTLHMVTEDGTMTEALMQWDPSQLPIPLIARYDALALFGYAVIEGGPAAWTWQEEGDENGAGTYFVGMARVRPLRDDERADTTAPALQNLHT